jgi:hypothetical protein
MEGTAPKVLRSGPVLVAPLSRKFVSCAWAPPTEYCRDTPADFADFRKRFHIALGESHTWSQYRKIQEIAALAAVLPPAGS